MRHLIASGYVAVSHSLCLTLELALVFTVLGMHPH